MSTDVEQWIDETFDADQACPVDGDEVAVREWVDSRLRRIAALRRERRIAAQIVANERARITAYEESEVGSIDRAIEFHEADVRAWMESRLAQDPKTKSYRLPAGTVQSRKLKDLVEIDPAVIPDLLHARPDLARQKFELNKEALNEAVAAGEEFDGVSVTTGRVSITVSVEGYGDAS